MKINRERLEQNLSELAKIGMNSTGGIDRALGSEADRQARKWLLNYWEVNLGVKTRIDAIANMWVRREGKEDLPAIVFGSHHDGALGVLLATEILQTISEQSYETRHPFEIVSFTGEEPNPFNVSTLGSKVLSGRLNKNDLRKLTSYIDGSSLQDCMLLIGGDIEKADDIVIKENDIRAFMECHIEQGRRLYDQKKTAAAVSCITGIYRENVIIYGESNHAGTTIMRDRKDALVAAARFILDFEEVIKDENREDIVGTIGYIDVFPNSANIIPGTVKLTLEIRTCSNVDTYRIIEKIDAMTAQIENKRNIKIERLKNLDQAAMPMDEDVTYAILESIAKAGQDKISLISMAGHDAANMQRVTKSSMIFVQSVNGKSHCPDEYTDMERIEETGNMMLDALLNLDKEMD